MNELNITELWQIFTENFLNHIIASPFVSVMLEAKYFFEHKNLEKAYIVAYLAILIAFICNYLLGRCFNLLKQYFDEKTKKIFNKAKCFFEGWGKFLILLAFLPFGEILLLLFGIVGISFKKIFMLLLIAAIVPLLKFFI